MLLRLLAVFIVQAPSLLASYYVLAPNAEVFDTPLYVDPAPYESPVVELPRATAFFVKRSAQAIKEQDPYRRVCVSNITMSHMPFHGQLENGTMVDIQQDENNHFITTYVECQKDKSLEKGFNENACFGINTGIFTSECATVYKPKLTRVRIAGTDWPFFNGNIKVPVACECRLRYISDAKRQLIS